MADLGNLMFRLGLNTKDFDKQMQDELAAAKKTAEEIRKAFEGITLPTGRGGKGGGSRGSSGTSSSATSDVEKQARAVNSLTAQYQKLHEALQKVSFAQSHTNKSGISANGSLTNTAASDLAAAMRSLDALIQKVKSGVSVPHSDIQKEMFNATRAIRESSTAIQQQRAINTEAQRAQLQGQAQILARQRAINAAQAENARLIARSNSHFSIMRNLVGQVGSMMGMYFSVYALQNFIQDLVRIRGEFDMQYMALKAILQSGQQANELFSQLKTLAPVSPYQFKDLATYAKQLSAYSIPYSELFDTTKRLADLSSGLGVDFYRIVLAYGQVHSATVLRGQELRQFTEAGIPMVDELAKKFTKLKGEVVSAGDVFQLISERQVPFQMVKEVIDDLTNEGGKFYMMQEKQSETLKGKVSNLADRYDIMMNSLGEANDGVLKDTVDALAAIMEHANLLVNAITKLAAVWGAWKLWTVAQTAAMGKNVAAMTAEEAALKRKEALLLREAALYRQLTVEEKAAMASRGVSTGMFGGGFGKSKLSSAELGQLSLNERLSKDQTLRLALLGKINQATMRELVLRGRITQEEARNVANKRLQLAMTMRQMPFLNSNIKWLRSGAMWVQNRLVTESTLNGLLTARMALYRGMSSLMAGLGAVFNPTTLVIAGITAAITAAFQYKQEQEEMAKNAQQLADNMKESYDDLRKFIADNPIELAIKSGDEKQMKEMVKRYAEELQKQILSNANNGIISSIYVDENGKERTLEEQLKQAEHLADLASQAAVFIQDNSDMLAKAAESTNGWLNENLKHNMEDYITEYGEFKDALYGLNKANILSNLDKTGWTEISENARKLKEQLEGGKASMEAIFATARKLAAEHLTSTKNPQFWKNSGFQDVFGEFGLYGKGDNNAFTSNGAFDTMETQIIDTAKEFKDKLQKALGDTPIDSEYGRMIVSQLKDSLIKNMNLPDDRTINLFNWIFDKELYGNADDALIQQAAHYLNGALSDASQEAVKGLRNGEKWGIAMDGALREACDKMTAAFPEMKDEIERLWSIPNLQVRINTALGVEEVEAWKTYLKDNLPEVYHQAIIMSTSPLQAKEAIQQAYDAMQERVDKLKPIAIKAGITPTFMGVSGWLQNNNAKDNPLLYPMMQQLEKELSNMNASQWGIDNGLITEKKTTTNKPKSAGSQKDKVTEAIQKQYDSQKKALQKFNELRKTVSQETTKDIIKKDYGVELQDSWLTQFGQIDLITATLNKLGKRSTDAAKNLRKSLNDEKAALLADKDVFGYSVVAENLSKDVDLLEKRFKVYDDFFKKSGNANLSALIAFGDQTKPYKDIVAATKAEFQKALDSDEGNKLKVEDLLGMSDEDIKRQLPEKFKSAFENLKKQIANGNENARSLLEEVFSKTDDEDVKIAINNANKEELLNSLSSMLFGDTAELTEEQQTKLNELRQMIEDYYSNLNKELTLDKIKKSMNWEKLFGNIGALSISQLDNLIARLEKIVDDNNDLDPEKMKEWVTQLNKIKEAKTGINDIFDVFKSIPKRNLANRTLTQTNKEVNRVNGLDYKGKELAQAFGDAIVAADTKAQKEIEQTEVTVKLMDAQGELQESTMTYSDLLKRQSSDQQTSDTLQKAADNATSGFFQGAAAKIFSKIGVKGASAGTEAGAGAGAGGEGAGGASAIAIVDAIIQLVHNNLSSMKDFVQAFGADENGSTSKWAEKVETYDSYVYGGWEKLKQGNFLGAVSDTINGWKAGLDLFKSDTAAIYEEEKERYNNLIEVWDIVIDRLKEVLEDSATEDILETASRMQSIYEQNIESARSMGREYLNAGASTGSHSYGIRQRDDMTDTGWAEWNAFANKYGISSSAVEGRMTGLFDLSVDQLKKLQEEASQFYAGLHEDTRKYIEQIIEASDNLEDLEDQLKEFYTSTTTDNIADDFASALDSMDDQTKTFANNFTKTLRNAIINAFMNSTAMKNKIQTFYDTMAEFAENSEYGAGGSIYSDREWDVLQGMWQDITDDATDFQSTLKKLGAYADQTSGSLSGSIQSITEETADLLASYVNAIRADVAFIRSYYAAHFADDDSQMQDVVTTISVAVAQIEVNTKRSADGVEDIKALLNTVVKTTSAGKALRMA